jgi:pantoate--beta-alanine ligase
MELVRRVQMMQEIVREKVGKGRKLAFVPTMGALHDGHLALVKRAKSLGDFVVVSIFVNPTQFGPNEDFARYPRDMARDQDLCIQEGVDYLFAPDASDMYDDDHATYVTVEGLSAMYEGATRPGHFRGVATVVLKLFNVLRPHFAVFGQKDAQQVAVIRRMVRDLNISVELVVESTQREEDGLALSSRNAHLDPGQRKAATALFRALERGRVLVEDEGVRNTARVEAEVRAVLAEEEQLRVDYVAVVDPDDFTDREELNKPTLIALAAWVGKTRLIDNALVHLAAQDPS